MNSRWTHTKTLLVTLFMWRYVSVTETLCCITHVLKQTVVQIETEGIQIEHVTAVKAHVQPLSIVSYYSKLVCHIHVILVFPAYSSVSAENHTRVDTTFMYLE